MDSLVSIYSNPRKGSSQNGPSSPIVSRTVVFHGSFSETLPFRSFACNHWNTCSSLTLPLISLRLLIMGDSDKPNPTTLRKRRGVMCASITHLATRLKDLEMKVDQPTTLDLAHRMLQKLDNLHQYEEQLRDYKKDLGDIRDSLLSQDLHESGELYTLQAKLEKEMFDCSLQIKKLLLLSRRPPESTPTPDDGKGVKLPKIDVPKFDGNIVNWKTWEQFCLDP